jgi:hypothetical protein
MVPPSHEIRPVGWNGIYCCLPVHWDIIVKGNCHLIIEQDLHPLLEFRWQDKAQPAKKNNTDVILSQLNRETDKQLEIIKPPQFLQTLHHRFELSTFTLDAAHPAGAVITCRKCGTAILLQFFNTTASLIEFLFSFFESFTCCPEDKQASYWAIEDLTFKIPQHFTLDSYSSSFGLTKFSFKNRDTNLKFCRLSGASKHLSHYTFTHLFANFNGRTSDECTVIDSNTLILDTPPSLGDRLSKIIKRKKIYRWAKFHRFADRDKILGIHVESRQPLERPQLALIEKDYGFIQ